MTHPLIALDLVGTLIHAAPPVASIYAQCAANYGIVRDESEIKQRFTEAFERAHFGCGTDLEHKGLWRAIVEHVFQVDSERCAPLFEDLWQHFGQPEAWTAYDDVAATIEQLRERGHRVVIASNFDARIEPILRGLNLWMDNNVFWSSALRASKPDRRFFEAIERATGFNGHSCLMVGDDVVNDYRGAVDAGWHAVLIDRKGGNSGQSLTTITSLQDLVDFVLAGPGNSDKKCPTS